MTLTEMTPLLVVATVLVPLLLAMAFAVRRLRPGLLYTLPLAALPGLALALFGTDSVITLPWLLEGGVWGIDDIRRVFLGFTALLWAVSGLFAIFYFRGDPRRERFSAAWSATLAGNLGLILAQDIACFYTFFSLMTFAAYVLVVHDHTPQANRAGRVYISMALGGEMMLLAGLIMAAAPDQLTLLADVPAAVAASDYRAVIVTLLLTGFGVKAGAPLLHLWLPLAHPVAPTPASAVLSGAMIKAGLFGWLYTLPLGLIALPDWGLLVLGAGLLATFGAALAGVCQRVPKAVLAYSSISQMGLITLMVGAALAAPELWSVLLPAIALYALHHGLAKGALFLGAGAAQHAGGLPRWLLWSLLWLPGLSLTGLSLTSGAAAKAAMKEALDPGAIPLALAAWLPTLLSAGAVATTLLVARFLWCLRDEIRDDNRPDPGLTWSWVIAAGCSLVLFWFLPRPEALAELKTGLAKPLGHLWPPALGLLLSALAVALKVRPLPIPPGDLLIPLHKLWIWLRTLSVNLARCLEPRRDRVLKAIRTLGTGIGRRSRPLLRAESSLRDQSGLGFAFVLVVLLLTLLLEY